MFDSQTMQSDGTVLAYLSSGSTLRAEVPVYAGGRLDALRLVPFRHGDKMEAGKRYLVMTGHVVRCVDGPRGPYVPASDGQALDGDGARTVAARVASLVISEAGDTDAGDTIVNLPTSKRRP